MFSGLVFAREAILCTAVWTIKSYGIMDMLLDVCLYDVWPISSSVGSPTRGGNEKSLVTFQQSFLTIGCNSHENAIKSRLKINICVIYIETRF